MTNRLFRVAFWTSLVGFATILLVALAAPARPRGTIAARQRGAPAAPDRDRLPSGKDENRSAEATQIAAKSSEAAQSSPTMAPAGGSSSERPVSAEGPAGSRFVRRAPQGTGGPVAQADPGRPPRAVALDATALPPLDEQDPFAATPRTGRPAPGTHRDPVADPGRNAPSGVAARTVSGTPRGSIVDVRPATGSPRPTRPSHADDLPSAREPFVALDRIDEGEGPGAALAPGRRLVSFEPLIESTPAPRTPTRTQTRTAVDSAPREGGLEARWTSLERQVEQLAMAQRTTELERTLQQLQQQQKQSQQHLQDQLRQIHAIPGVSNLLQSVGGGAPPAAAPATGAGDPGAVPNGGAGPGGAGFGPGASAGDGAARTLPPAAPPARKAPVIRTESSGPGSERFSMQIQDADIHQVLEMLGGLAGRNIFASPAVKGLVSINLHDVTVEEALEGIVSSRGLAHESDDRFVYVFTQEEADARRRQRRKVVTKVFRPNYISTADLKELVTPLLTPAVGKVAVTLPSEVGIKTDAESAGGDHLAQRDVLLVQDYEEILKQVDAILVEMDVPPMQVVIEAMILSVRLSDSMQFGVNFALLGNNSNQLLTSGNGAVVNGTTGFPGSGSNSLVPPMGQFIADTAGLKYGFLRGDIAMFINALENLSDTNLIASPQLRVLNKQRAQLIIGKRLSYTTRTFQNNQTIENVNFLDAGTKLVLRPFAAPDGLVRMEIHPERSSATINPETKLPDLETTEVTTNVMVRDGTTVVIGGLIEETTTESVDKVPLLGSLPLVGRAFRNTSERTDRTELIVLITPRVVREPEAAAEGDLAKHESAERRRNFLEHLQPMNRMNLVRGYLERAQQLYDEGSFDRALAQVERALELSKNDAEAIRLRDRILEARREKIRSLWRWGRGDSDAAVPVEAPPPETGPAPPAAGPGPALDAAPQGPATGPVPAPRPDPGAPPAGMPQSRRLPSASPTRTAPPGPRMAAARK